MKTGDKRSTRNPSCYSRGVVSTRSFERTATRYPMQAVIFTFREFEFPLKNFSLVRSISTKLSEFFEKTLKKRGGMRACALGYPRPGSVFALVQRR
jgi:hypothetical protein